MWVVLLAIALLVDVAARGSRFSSRSAQGRLMMLGWTAPNGIAMCQGDVVVRLTLGSRPWTRLSVLASTRQSLSSRCTVSIRQEGRYFAESLLVGR